MSEGRRKLIPRSTYPWLTAFSAVAFAVAAVLLTSAHRVAGHRPQPVRTANAVGDSTCISCHRDKAAFEQTAHRLTLRLPTRESILKNFERGSNVLRTDHPDMHFRMDADSTGFYQTLVVGKGPDSTSRTERVAYVAGSGRKGQSFLYWSGDKLFQLPVSYYTGLDTWLGSPGRVGMDPRVSFNRAVAPRCFECHASWMESVPNLSADNEYNAKGAILGITCERCHASGQQHVTHERSLLRLVVRDRSIVNPAPMPRERKMEVCAQCHGGLGEPRLPAFTYVAGRRLEDYVHLEPKASDEVVDVHANQVALLSRSRCFTGSQMTCTTCHDVHRPQRDLVELSGRCLTCHQQQSCPLFATRGTAIVGKCVDCHMPLQTSKIVVSDLEGSMQRVKGRTHWIRVYPDSTVTEPGRR
jgi:mono/diheme cytochrome c family protein